MACECDGQHADFLNLKNGFDSCTGYCNETKKEM